MDQDRREFGLTLAAIIVVAGQASHDMATADPPPLTLEEMEDAAVDLRDRFYFVPPAALLREAAGQWHAVHQLLQRPISGRVRDRVLVLAGTVACRAASLGRFAGDQVALRRFSVLAGQYAAKSGDPLLAGEVAVIRSRTAFGTRQFMKAAMLAAEGRAAAHPGQRARLAACEAEAWGAAGRGDDAHAALADMRALSTRAIRWADSDQAICTAVTLSALGEHRPAADLASTYVGSSDNDPQGIGWAQTVIGRASLASDRPDPAAAAHHGRLALAATADADLTVITRVSDLHGQLRRTAPRAADVAELGQAIADARAALTA
jgi:hypothetical protein